MYLLQKKRIKNIIFYVWKCSFINRNFLLNKQTCIINYYHFFIIIPMKNLRVGFLTVSTHSTVLCFEKLFLMHSWYLQNCVNEKIKKLCQKPDKNSIINIFFWNESLNCLQTKVYLRNEALKCEYKKDRMNSSNS
jgi:hypothetical protein